MEDSYEVLTLPNDLKSGSKFIVKLLMNEIWPVVKSIKKKLDTDDELIEDTDTKKKLQDVFTLCCSQLQKCVSNLFEVFKLEEKQKVVLQESRSCTLDRLSWCLKKIKTINDIIIKLESQQGLDSQLEESILVTPMYFVNWIDQTFDILTKLSNLIYKNDQSSCVNESWKEDMVESITELHVALDELMLTAMTLCKYCLESDQLIVKARCQVVLRESKALLSELITGDVNSNIKINKTTLKLPIMPSNVNVLIDVLRDVLYVLETNTNTALLALVIHCFSSSKCPCIVLKEHLSEPKGCQCENRNQSNEIAESCLFVNEFDLLNERLMQIGSFAVSCSSDQNRISILRSGLASIECLDPHMVPALILSPNQSHAHLLMQSWQQEVQTIRDSVFLIVDPAAFVEKAMHMMNTTLLAIVKEKYENVKMISDFINYGSLVHTFFLIYDQQEPDALLNRDKLLELLIDLHKADVEVKIVTNIIFGNTTFPVKMPTINLQSTTDQLSKRLKLLYTLVKRINTMFHPKENEELFVDEICEGEPLKNTTHAVNKNNGQTYLHSMKANLTRSIFARTNARTPNKQFILKRFCKQLDRKHFSFSVDSNCEVSVERSKGINKSVLYKYSQNRSSLRKAVLSKKVVPIDCDRESNCSGNDVDGTTSLHITEILNQMSNITGHQFSRTNKENILSLTINDNTVSKKVWTIPINKDDIITPIQDESQTSSQQSDVTTQERLTDISNIEKRLNKLKYVQQETEL